MRTHHLLVGALCVAGFAQAQTYDSVGEFLNQATPATHNGATVEITRAVASTGDIRRGGALPDRDTFIQHMHDSSQPWRNPYMAFFVGDALGGQPPLRISFTTQQWYDAYDDVLVADRAHPEIRRGYVMRLKGRVRYSQQYQTWTLYPTATRFRVDEGLEVTGSVGDALRPFVQTLDYRDNPSSPGAPLRLEGYHFDAQTKVFVAGVEVPVREVSADGKKLTAEMTASVGHGPQQVTVSRGTAGGGGSVEVRVSQLPVITRTIPEKLVAGGFVVVEGSSLSTVSAWGDDHASAELGGRSLFAVHVSATSVVFKLPDNLAPGVQDLIVTNGAGDSAPKSVEVETGVGAPELTAVHATASGALVILGTGLKVTEHERVSVILSTGETLRPLDGSAVSVSALLPAGVNEGTLRVRVDGRGESNALPFRRAGPATTGVAGALGNP